MFGDGSSYQRKATPPANWVAPMHNIGYHFSPNGTVAYRSNAFGGALRGDLLVVNFSIPDNLIRIQLSPNGQSVVSQAPLADKFTGGPLALAEGGDGTLYVGELYTDQISVLKPAG